MPAFACYIRRRYALYLWSSIATLVLAVMFSLIYPAYRQQLIVTELRQRGFHVQTRPSLGIWWHAWVPETWHDAFSWVESIQADAVVACDDNDIETCAQLIRLNYSTGPDPVECSLFLDAPKITDTGLRHLVGIKSIYCLAIRSPNVTDLGMEYLSRLKSLSILHITRAKLTDKGLARVVALSKLQSLTLSETLISDRGLSYLSGLKALNYLNLSETAVNGEGFVHLTGLSNLETLLLDETQVSDIIIPYLVRLKKLRLLHLSGTQMTFDGYRELKEHLPDAVVFR